MEVLLKEVEEKEHEFQGYKKHIEGLQRSNGDTLNSCLKDVNEMCDKLIEEIEARRAYLIAELHSKHEGEEEQNKGEMNSIDLSLVRLSDSIRFTRKLLDDGNDVELMTVGMQAKEALAGLSTMTWKRETVRPSLLRLKFAPVMEDMKSFGKVLNTIQSSDVLIENIPQDAYVGDELEFNVKLSDEIKYDAATLLSVTVTHNTINLPATVENNGLNNWKISCTPQDGGEHTIDVKFGQFASPSRKFVVGEILKMEKMCDMDYNESGSTYATSAINRNTEQSQPTWPAPYQPTQHNSCTTKIPVVSYPSASAEHCDQNSAISIHASGKKTAYTTTRRSSGSDHQSDSSITVAVTTPATKQPKKRTKIKAGNLYVSSSSSHVHKEEDY